MKVLILGATGMLGHKLCQKLKDEFEVHSTIRGDFDRYRSLPVFEGVKIVRNIFVENTQLLYTTLSKIKPDVIINAVGIIKQLPDSKNNIKTIIINALLPHQLAAFTTENNIRLINISTDCVFSGKKGNYLENEYPDAFDLYGKSKNLGEVVEDNCITLRTSIIGRELFTSHSLVEWFLANRGRTIRGYVNAIYTGFPTIVLAEILTMIIKHYPGMKGLLHLSSDKINKFELLTLINNQIKADVNIEAFEDFYIDRSLDSTRFRTITGFQPPEWEEMIRIMVDDGKIYDQWRK